MSLIITTYAPEGIILAGDSRLTLNWNKEINGHQTQFSLLQVIPIEKFLQ